MGYLVGNVFQLLSFSDAGAADEELEQAAM